MALHTAPTAGQSFRTPDGTVSRSKRILLPPALPRIVRAEAHPPIPFFGAVYPLSFSKRKRYTYFSPRTQPWHSTLKQKPISKHFGWGFPKKPEARLRKCPQVCGTLFCSWPTPTHFLLTNSGLGDPGKTATGLFYLWLRRCIPTATWKASLSLASV